jgi:hypothetical protein
MMERQVVMSQMTGEHFCQHVRGEAGGCPEMKAGVRWTSFEAQENRRLAWSSLFACHQAACEALREGRLIEWSGRRGSNPRQPAWKAGILPLRYFALAITSVRQRICVTSAGVTVRVL